MYNCGVLKILSPPFSCTVNIFLFVHLSIFLKFLDCLTHYFMSMCPTISMGILFWSETDRTLCLSVKILFPFVLYIGQSNLPVPGMHST